MHASFSVGKILPCLKIKTGEHVARCGREGEYGLLDHSGLLRVPDKHPVVHVETVLLQVALASRVPGLHLQ